MKVKSLKLNMVLAGREERREKMTVIRELSGETLSPEIFPNITEIPSNNLKMMKVCALQNSRFIHKFN